MVHLAKGFMWESPFTAARSRKGMTLKQRVRSVVSGDIRARPAEAERAALPEGGTQYMPAGGMSVGIVKKWLAAEMARSSLGARFVLGFGCGCLLPALLGFNILLRGG